MIEKVLETIEENNMFQKGDKVIVAVSGGPDSICLLNVLYSLKDKLEISIAAAHVNHCLRGMEADGDEKYVEDYCKSLGIDFYSRREDIKKVAEEKNISLESAGRIVRYDFFDALKTKLSAQKIALAHNANDQAETVLMRIFRGTGLEGLAGIRPVRDGIFVRPLINVTRDDIEEYCEDNMLNPRIDKTNLESIYTRNKIRLELLPYLKENFNQDIVNVLNRLADTTSRDNEYLEEISLNKFSYYCEIKGNMVIINKDAFFEKEPVLSRIVRNAIYKLKGNIYNLERVHIFEIINLSKSGTGKKIMLPNSLIAENIYGNIHIYTYSENKINNINTDRVHRINIGENSFYEDYNLAISSEVLIYDKKLNFQDKNNTKYFDYDKINGNIFIRYRKAGDTFSPLGMKGRKKIKDIFIDLKIPRQERERIPLICFENEIAWIVGYRTSESFKIDNTTKKVLKLTVESGDGK